MLSIASLLLSAAALSIAVFGLFRPAKPDPEQVRTLVDAELQGRETKLVNAWAPKFRGIYEDMLGGDVKLSENALNPKNLSDLFSPLVTIVEKMQGGSSTPKDGK